MPAVTDSGLVQHASQSNYQELLAGGVRLFQMKSSVLHAKTAVVDSNWSTVGSSNIDTRSFLHNSELNVIVMGDEFGGEMEKAFQEDVRDSVQITPEAWHHRPLADRMREWAARFMDYWI